MHEMYQGEDLLASGLISISANYKNTFFNQKVVETTNMLPDDSANANKTKKASQGTRILPVYVLSLIGKDENLLIDHRSLFVA
jgi:hypothetical protein